MTEAERFKNFRERTLPPSHRDHAAGESACRIAFDHYRASCIQNWGCPDLTNPPEETSNAKRAR